MGLVPETTLETAKLVAYSAGAKLSQVLSYRLTSSDIRALEQSPPDILLFAGGTDGGNSEYVLANAKALGESRLSCSMVYAGNRSVWDEVSALLANKDFCAVENLLPTLEASNPEPVREALRAIFLRRIVKGKGLDKVIGMAGSDPVPTPYAMYEFSRAIREHVPGWQDFIAVDIGGATTDVYSAHRESPQARWLGFKTFTCWPSFGEDRTNVLPTGASGAGVTSCPRSTQVEESIHIFTGFVKSIPKP